MRIRPASRIKGQLRVPGDKSISHRAALIAALANGTSTISNFSTGADCAATIACLEALGVTVAGKEGNLIVNGVGRQGFKPATAPLDCGNSGSTMRMLAGVLAGQNFAATLIGDNSLSARPMTRIIEPLEAMGAMVRSQEGKPPLTIIGSASLKSIAYNMPVRSAQVKSCVLLAALNAGGVTKVTESLVKSRDHTERMLQWFGASLSLQTLGATSVVSVQGPGNFTGRSVTIPGDISSAAYFVAAAALLPNSELLIEDVGLNSTRTEFLSLLKFFGLSIDLVHTRDESNEPVGNIRVLAQRREIRTETTLSGAMSAQMIDELPLLAVVGTQIPGGIEIRDAEELRLKESDRIATTVTNLRAMGAPVKEFDDGLRVEPSGLHGAKIKTFGDHRIAMAFTVAALLAKGETEIDDGECVRISFPEFFEVLESIVEL
ncbi:MAG: 3-phosphoshikimate 1-carboxyvinyltransferase [Pyrinomonadaceae bacterium]